MENEKRYPASEAVENLLDVWGRDEAFVDRIAPEVKSDKDILMAMTQTFGMLYVKNYPYKWILEVAFGYLMAHINVRTLEQKKAQDTMEDLEDV